MSMGPTHTFGSTGHLNSCGPDDIRKSDCPFWRRFWYLWAIVVLLCAQHTRAQSVSSTFDAANKLYEQAKFEEAASAYEQLLHKGQSSEAVFFNWGNALFKSGKIGRAIMAYQMAERVAPRDPDMRANLQFARNQVSGPTLLPDRVWRWLGKLTLNEWTWLASVSVWTWLLLLTIVQWKPKLKIVFGSYSIWAGILAATLCTCFAAAWYWNEFAQRAIIVVPEAVARQAPLEESPNAFTLHDGAELEVLDQKDQWLQVKIDARRSGWVPKEAVVTRGVK